MSPAVHLTNHLHGTPSGVLARALFREKASEFYDYEEDFVVDLRLVHYPTDPAFPPMTLLAIGGLMTGTALSAMLKGLLEILTPHESYEYWFNVIPVEARK